VAVVVAADEAEEERRLLLQQVGRRRRRRRRRGRREEEGLVPPRLRGMLCHVSGPVLRAVCVCCVVVGEGVKTEWGVAPLARHQRFAVSFGRVFVCLLLVYEYRFLHASLRSLQDDEEEKVEKEVEEDTSW